MARTFQVSVACPDRTGLISAITARLFDLGGNLGDTTFAVLGTEAEFASLVDLPESLDAESIRGELAALPECAGADIDVTPYDRPTAHGPLGRASHVITVSGGDQPGLVARITEVCGEFGANILHLEARRDPGPEPTGHYTTRFSVAIPEANAMRCLVTIANTAEAMDLVVQWEQVPA